MDREHESGFSERIADPSPLTTLQLDREITSLKSIIFTRLDAMDKALGLFQDNMTRVPTDTDKQIQHLKELHDERFKGIELQFSERDIRAEHTAKEGKVAVDAALQAAKESVGEQNKSSALAIGKSETAINKQMEQLGTLLQTNTAALSDKIDDIKGRLTLIEGKSFGAVATDLGHRNSSSFIVALIVAAVSVAGLVIMIAGKLNGLR